MPIIYNEDLKRIDEEYGDRMIELSGPTLMGFPDGCDSSRLNMMAQNIKQILCLINPQVPRIFTGVENEIGKYNKAFMKLSGTWEVKDKIEKFGTGHVYMLILYNRAKDLYDIIEKNIAEDLTEKFGFMYNTSEMDNLKVGDKITDKVIYKSTSYDDDMNYRPGVNARVMYVTDPSTIEDAIKIRRGWAESIKSVEVDTALVGINQNDVLLNLFGNDEEYKSFADIGEKIPNGTLCALRRINYQHILYDFLPENMREINTTDRDFVTSKDAIIYDMDIYCNNPEGLPDNIFYNQLNGYFTKMQEYADKITEWCTKIKQSGSNYTDNVGYYKHIYQHYNDTDYKWTNKDREFDNIMIKFKTVSEINIQTGYKLVGRYGDKGVVSKVANSPNIDYEEIKKSIMDMVDTSDMSEDELVKMLSNIQVVDDDEMPYTDDGVHIDILLNASGSIRRLNSDQIVEVDLNFASERIRQKLCTLESYDEKEDLIFEFLKLLNNGQYDFIYDYYNSFDKTIKLKDFNLHLIDNESKHNFIDEVCEKGFYIHKPPYSKMRYDLLKNIYNAFPWIEPYDVYVNLFGMRKKIMKKMVVGEKYMFLLKQTTGKNFSARSTGRLNKKNLPEKSADKKNNRTPYSKNPIRIGEAYNLFATISPMLLAEYDVFMRSSPIGRNSLKRILKATDNPLAIKKLKVTPDYNNSNAIITKSYLKAIGIGLNPVMEDEQSGEVIEMIQPLDIYGTIIYDYPSKLQPYRDFFKLKDEFLENNMIAESYEGEKDDIAWSYVLNSDKAKNMSVYKVMKEIITNSLTNKDTYNKINEEIKNENVDKFDIK